MNMRGGSQSWLSFACDLAVVKRRPRMGPIGKSLGKSLLVEPRKKARKGVRSVRRREKAGDGGRWGGGGEIAPGGAEEEEEPGLAADAGSLKPALGEAAGVDEGGACVRRREKA